MDKSEFCLRTHPNQDHQLTCTYMMNKIKLLGDDFLRIKENK